MAYSYKKSNYKYNNDHSRFSAFSKKRSVKDLCKTAIKNACDNKVDELTIEQIYESIDNICSEMKIEEESLKQEVQATFLNIIIKYIPHLETGMVDCIKKLTKPINEIMKHSMVNSNTKEIRSAMGFELLNSICWPCITQVSSIQEYVMAIETLISVGGCDVLSKNSKNETALNSYENACVQQMAPDSDEIRNILQYGIRRENLIKKVKILVNKLSLGNMDKFSNFFKVSIILDIDLLVEKILETSLNIYAYSKQNGYFQWIVNNVDIYRKILCAPINNDEWTTFLNLKFENPEGSFDELLRKITLSALSKKDAIMAKENYTTDIIGAFVGEASAILDDNFYSPFVYDLLDNENIKLEINQNLMATATAHLLNRLTLMDSPKNAITKYITLDIINKLIYLATNEILVRRIVIQFEMSVKNFRGEYISINNMASIFD